MKKKELNYIEEFHKSIEKIAQIRHKSMDMTDKVYSQIIDLSKNNEVPDFVWHDIGLQFFHSDRFELAEEAMLKAVETGEKLSGEDRKYLAAIYGDLAMIYEQLEKYSDALKARELGLKVKLSFYDDSNENVKWDKELLEKVRVKVKNTSKAIKSNSINFV